MHTLDRRALHDALKVLARVAPTHSAKPIITNVLLRAEHGKITLTATDYTTRLSCELPSDSDDLLEACVPAKLFAGLLKSTTKRDTGLVSLKRQENQLLIEIGGVTARLSITDPADFPSVFRINLDWTTVGTCDGQALYEELSWVLLAASADVTRRYLCAVLINTESIVATDGHRMHIAKSPVSLETPLLIASSTAEILRRVLSDNEQTTLAHAKDDNHEYLRVCSGPWQLETTPADATFPPYQEVTPVRDYQLTRFCVERAIFLQALRQVTAVARDSHLPVKLCISSTLLISQTDCDGNETSAVVPITVNAHSGEDLVIEFNPRYLTEAMQGNSDIAVELSFKGLLDPLRVDSPDGRVAVIMPYRS